MELSNSEIKAHYINMRTLNSKKSFILFSVPAILCLIFCSLFLLSCTNKEGGSAAEDEQTEVSPEEMEVRVKTVKIETGEMPVMIKAAGVLLPAMQSPALVVPLTSGIVSKVEVREGQKVEAGTVIIRLDSRQAENALAKAKAGLKLVEADLQKATQGGLDIEQSELDLDAIQAEVAVQQAQLDNERQKSLFAEHLTSEKASIDAQKALEETQRRAKAATDKVELFRKFGRQTQLTQLQAAVDQSKAEVAEAEFNREITDIRAPVSGRISGLNINVGSSVDDKTVLAQVIGEQTAVVRLQLSPVDIENIELGAPVNIRPVSSKEVISGTVVSIGYQLDTETGLVPVETQLNPNQSRLARIGETVFAEITTKLKVKGFIVPASSIIIEDDKASLFTVDDKEIAHAVPIEILTRTADTTVVTSEGLQSDAKVIIDGNYNLPDGAHVVEETSNE